jgi:hypothetical protein
MTHFDEEFTAEEIGLITGIHIRSHCDSTCTQLTELNHTLQRFGDNVQTSQPGW